MMHKKILLNALLIAILIVMVLFICYKAHVPAPLAGLIGAGIAIWLSRYAARGIKKD